MSVLQQILNRQRELQKKYYGVDVATLTDEQRAEYIRSMALALADELHEALNETGWKPWATSRHINREAYLGELIDVLHFWANLVLVVNTNEEELTAMYFAKADKNAKRQLAGYDGVQGKCTTCGRAFDDAAVLCTPVACEHIE